MGKRAKPKSAKTSSGLVFNHAMIYVRCLAPAVHFYVDLLGFKQIEVLEGSGFPCYARLRALAENCALNRSSLPEASRDAGMNLTTHAAQNGRPR